MIGFWLPSDFESTLVSLAEENKLKRLYLMGAYGWAKLKIGGSVSKRALRKALAILEIDLDAALEPGDCEGHGLEAYLDERLPDLVRGDRHVDVAHARVG